uniref:Reverse transcriptase domain-containing protein n=1 Tax=Tanacetum cinerariifolium TaxID=118510 RepID=A0A699GNP6_TANCI|nr:reverse transcriptase domain-containing protein [Tanacetum cinerariifolium]
MNFLGLVTTYPPLRLEGLPFELERDLLPIILRNIHIVSSGVKPSLRSLPTWKSVTRRPTPFAVRSSTKPGQRLDLVKSKPTFFLSTKAFSPRTPENTPLTNHASILANPNPMISSAFIEANYEVLESILRGRMKQKRNEDLRTELEYFSEEYDEEREMEPRPVRNRETTPALRTEFPRDNGHQGMSLPSLLGAHLGRSKNCQLLQSSLTSVYGGHQPFTNIGGNLPHNGLFTDYTGCVTPFVYWIEDYPLPDGLLMPSHVGSYDGKGDPDNYLYLFEGAIHMQKWTMPIACHMFTYTLMDSARIWWNGQKAVHNIKQREGKSTRDFVTRSLVEFLFTDLPTTYKGLMEKNYTWIEAKEVATNGTLNDHREGFDRFKKNSSWDNNKRKKNRDSESSKNLRTTPRMIESRRSRDMTKYFYFYEDHGHDTNDCRELKHQIEETVKSGKLRTTREILATEKDLKHQIEEVVKSGSLRVDVKVLLVGISGEHSWPLGEVPLEIAIEELAPYSRHEPDKIKEGKIKLEESPPDVRKGVLSYVDAEEKIVVNDKYPEQKVTIRNKLPPIFKKKLQDLLRSNADIFAWTYVDMTRILKTITGYHQIQMAEGDEDKTTIFAGKRVFCYRKMPFGSKNAWATYQRLVDKIFSNQIGRNLKAYVDDIVIKSTFEEEMLKDIEENFDRFRSVNMKLNLKKCSFGEHEPMKKKIPKDFSIEMPSKGEERKTSIKVETKKESLKLENMWKLYNDGDSNSDGSSAILMLISHKGKEYTYAPRFEFETTNNEAEYKALQAGLQIV